jgi:DNA-binding transcriptional MerR regulator
VSSKDALTEDETEFAAVLPDKLFFRIGEAAELVGVETHVLRYWESEFRMRPQRSSTGQRMYRRRDLARFFRIKKLLHEEGFTIAGARRALTGGAPVEAAPAADSPQVREAVERLHALRRRIGEIRARFRAAAPSAEGAAKPS